MLLQQKLASAMDRQQRRAIGREHDARWPHASAPVHLSSALRGLFSADRGTSRLAEGDSIFHSFLVHIAAKCATGNMATDASFLVRLAYSRLGRLKTLDWPAFWDDPSPGFAGGDKQHFNASLSIKPVRQRSKLNASWSALS